MSTSFTEWWSFNSVHYENQPLTKELAEEIFDKGEHSSGSRLEDTVEKIKEDLSDTIDDAIDRFFMRIGV